LNSVYKRLSVVWLAVYFSLASGDFNFYLPSHHICVIELHCLVSGLLALKLNEAPSLGRAIGISQQFDERDLSAFLEELFDIFFSCLEIETSNEYLRALTLLAVL
jgi:hypothetical protein